MAATIVKKKYWIDASCHNYLGKGAADFNVYVEEAMRLARLAVGRLASKTDADFSRVFNVLFKTPKTDATKYPRSDLWCLLNGEATDPSPPKTVLKHVIDNLEDFGNNWVRSTVQADAHLRIYSGPMTRFKLDPANPAEWVDSNRVPRPASSVVNGVPVPPPGVHSMPSTSYQGYHMAPLDFFDGAWRGLGVLPQIIDPTKFTVDVETLDIKYMAENFLPKYIIHEFMHCFAYGCEDTNGMVKGGPWNYSIKLEKEQAYKGADAIATLAFMAGMAEYPRLGKTAGGWTLDRLWDTIPGPNDLGAKTPNEYGTGYKWDVTFVGEPLFGGPKENSVLKGKLVWYDNITK